MSFTEIDIEVSFSQATARHENLPTPLACVQTMNASSFAVKQKADKARPFFQTALISTMLRRFLNNFI
ncbi:MAG: hypothetical protein VX617_05890, partial [Pseudomonadota bacterium]|nr:hypothetical protein [Pseudomonadota bacterium]